MARITAQFVKNHAIPGKYDDGGGMGLRLWIRKDGGKQWVQRLTVNGKRVDRGLGSWPAVSLLEAREKAARNQKKARKGVDPLAKKRGKGGKRTFEEIARQRHAELLPGFKNNKHGEQWINTLAAYVFPHIGDIPVKKVQTEDIKDLLLAGNLWQEKCETARRVLQRIGVVMRYSVICRYRKDDPTLYLKEIMPVQSRQPVPMASLPYAEVPTAIAMVRGKGGWPPVRLALEFLALTAVRPGEVRGALWLQIDMEAAIWTIPAEAMKMGREHVVPLSDRCLEILDEAGGYVGDEGLVFPNRGRDKPLSDMALLKAMRDLKLDAVPHGFRSSFRTWVQERTNTPHEVAETALAHSTANKTVAAYARSDYLEKRRPLMQTWADYIASAGDEIVVSLGRS